MENPKSCIWTFLRRDGVFFGLLKKGHKIIKNWKLNFVKTFKPGCCKVYHMTFLNLLESFESFLALWSDTYVIWPPKCALRTHPFTPFQLFWLGLGTIWRILPFGKGFNVVWVFGEMVFFSRILSLFWEYGWYQPQILFLERCRHKTI